MAAHNELGKWGEDFAVLYLQSNGYLIAGRNWRYGRYEVDIIAIDGDECVFIEVKTRSTTFLEPELSINAVKAKYISDAAYGYVKYHRLTHAIRFDVITIVAQPHTEPVVTHYKNAFHPAAINTPKRRQAKGWR